MPKVTPQPVSVDIDFTDAQLTGQGGLTLLAQLAREGGLLDQFAQRICLKRRRRGASDIEMLWSLVASLASGDGALSDLDALGQDPVTAQLLGIDTVPSGRRLGEYLTRMGLTQLDALQAIARHMAPTILDYQVETRGYVPVFVDGTAIEVDGRLFESAGKGHDGSLQYWLHGVFVGGLWASGRLHPGGVDVAAGWREQLEHDVAPLLGDRHPVWLHADNAYYRGDLIRYCRERGRDYSPDDAGVSTLPRTPSDSTGYCTPACNWSSPQPVLSQGDCDPGAQGRRSPLRDWRQCGRPRRRPAPYRPNYSHHPTPWRHYLDRK